MMRPATPHLRGVRRSRTRMTFLAGAALTAVAITGCSSSSPTTAAGGSATPQAGSVTAHQGKITIKADDQLMFTPAVVTTTVGTLTVRLVNSGSYPHNLVVPALHVTSATVSGDPGSTSTTVTLHFTKPGRYPFECVYHAAAGMRGTFIVK